VDSRYRALLCLALALNLLIFTNASSGSYSITPQKTTSNPSEDVFLFISTPPNTVFTVKLYLENKMVSEDDGRTSSRGNSYVRYSNLNDPGKYKAKLYVKRTLKASANFKVENVDTCPSCVRTTTTSIYVTSTSTTTSTLPFTSTTTSSSTIPSILSTSTTTFITSSIESDGTETKPLDEPTVENASSSKRLSLTAVDGGRSRRHPAYSLREKPSFKVDFKPKERSPGGKRLLGDSGLDFKVFDSSGKEASLDVEVAQVEGGFEVSIPPKRGMRPGLYKLNVSVFDGLELLSAESEFAWGLVSVNTRKSIYRPGEEAEFIIVVLDRAGRPVCDTVIELNVTDPLGVVSSYSTGNSIFAGSECGLYDMSHPTSELGNHTFAVTASFDGINVNFESFFLVAQDFAFDITRTAESKIDPTSTDTFTVVIDVESYVGGDSITIKEYVPAVFEVESGATVESFLDYKVLTWMIDLSENKTSVNYSYSVPHVWPYLYQLGEAEIIYDGQSFSEARSWYVAVDPTYGGEASGGLRPQSITCYEDGASEACSGTYPTSCPSSGGTDRLSCNDASQETHGTRKGGFAGVEGSYYSTSITDCLSITKVEICYEWSSTNNNPSACLIAVDANGGASYNNVITSCPGSAGASGCYDATNDETWTCANFFGASGTRAYARSFQTSAAASPTTCYWDQLWYNVTYTQDQPPDTTWGVPAAATWYARSDTAIHINCSATDDVDVANVTFTQDADGVGSYSDIVTDTDDSDGDWNWSYNPSVDSGPCASASIGATGTCYVGCYATDSNGQDDASPATSNIRIDGESPTGFTASIQGESEGTWLSDSSFTVQCAGATDPNSGSGVSTHDYEYTLTNDCSAGWTSISGCTDIAGDCSWGSPPSDTDDFCIRCRATDTVGNDGTWDEATYLGNDNTEPDCTMTDPLSSGDITVSPYTLTASESDSGSGVYNVTFEYNNGTGWYQACTGSSDPFDCAWAPPANIEDLTNIQVRANCSDVARLNNLSSAQTDITIDVVDQAPTADLASVSAYVSASQNLDASGSTEPDPTDDLNTYIFNISSDSAFTSPYTVCSSASDSCSWDTTSVGSTTECPDQTTCYVRVWVNDTRGSPDYSDFETTFIDNTGPDSTTNWPLNDTIINSESYTVNASADDGSGSGVSCVDFDYYNGSWNDLAVDCAPPYEQNWDLSSIPDQTGLQVRARANDTLNNWGGFDAHGNITHDTTPPTAVLDDPDDSEILTSSPYTLNASSSTDATAGIANCTWYYSLAGAQSWNEIGSDTIPSDGLTFSWGLPADDTYDVNATCFDAAGFSATDVSTNVVVDVSDSPPTCTVSFPDGGENLTGYIIVNATASEPDPADVVESVAFNYSTDGGGSWTLIGTNSTSDLASYSFVWDTSGIDSDTVKVQCLATDTRSSTGVDDSNDNCTVDNTEPAIYGEEANSTTLSINEYLCLNATVSDNLIGVNAVWAILDRPDPELDETVFLTDDGANCDATASDGVYSLYYQNTLEGDYNWAQTSANDSVGNTNTSYPELTWTVTSPASMTVSVASPASDVVINESVSNTWFWLNCSAACDGGGGDCESVELDAEYFYGGAFRNTNSTTHLLNDVTQSCGTLTAGGSACEFGFNLSSGPGSGGGEYEVRCHTDSPNAGSAFSTNNPNASVNDPPVANMSYPSAAAWLTGVENLNGSYSSDAEDDFSTYKFELDNVSSFASPSTLCEGASVNCTFDTVGQGQCAEESADCYIRLTVSDGWGLSNQTTVQVGIDNTGPTATLDRPGTSVNISASTYTVNASVSDGGVGTVSAAIFEYRINSTETWQPACTDSDGSSPFECSWDTSSLTELETYEFHVRGNDSLGNLGGYDSHTQITIDRTDPNIILHYPAQNQFLNSTSLSLNFTPQDNVATQMNCSLYIDDAITDSTIASNDSVTTLSSGVLSEDSHTWNVNCTDAPGNFNSSETRTFIIDLTLPVVNLEYPSDGSWFTISSFDFNYTPTDLYTIDVCELWANFSGTWAQVNTENDPVNFSVNNFTKTLSDGEFIWNVWCNDSAGNGAYNSSNYTVYVDTQNPTISFISSTLSNNSLTNNDWIFINVSASDANKLNVTLNWNGVNESFNNFNGDNYWENKTGLSEGTSNFTAFVNDSAGRSNTTGLRYVTVDLTYPGWSNLNQTLDGTHNTVFHRNDLVNLTSNWTDSGSLSSAWLSINDSGVWINPSSSYGSPYAFSGTSNLSSFAWTNTSVAPGTFVSWRVYANDSFNRVNQTDTMNFTVWGWSEVSDMELSPNKIVPDGATLIGCKVGDNVSLSGVENYVVSFYNSTNQLGTNTTNNTGWAIYNYNQSAEGSMPITCNITHDGPKYYNASGDFEQTASLTIETGRENQSCVNIYYNGGTLSGNCGSINVSDNNYLDWKFLEDVAAPETYYFEVDTLTNQPWEIISSLNFTWEVNRVVLNYAESFLDPNPGVFTMYGGVFPDVTFDAYDNQYMNLTEEISTGSKMAVTNGQLNFYVPEADTEVTYSKLKVMAQARQATVGASGDTLQIHAYNFQTSSFDLLLFSILDFETSWANYTYSITVNPEYYIDTTGLVQLRFQDTDQTNGETTSMWYFDYFEVVAYYDNPVTGNVYNYTIGYVDQSSGSRVRIEEKSLTGADVDHSAKITSGISQAVSYDGNVTGYLTFWEAGTPTQDTKRRTSFAVDNYQVFTGYDATLGRDLNITVINASQNTFTDTVVSVYNMSDFKILSKTLSQFDTRLDDILIHDVSYKIKQDIPLTSDSLMVNIWDLNLTNNLVVTSQVVEKYGGDKPDVIDNITVLYALNDSGLSFSAAELLIPKAGNPVDQVMHCLSWDWASASCSSWDVNETEHFNMQENSTHIWFNVTSFDTFGGGGGSTLPNLTNIQIYDVTGQAQTHWGGTLVGSGLNRTFDLMTVGVYRVEFNIKNDGISWKFDGSDFNFHDGLNSTWDVDSVNDIWYTDDGGTTNYTGGTWSSGNVSWGMSLGGDLKTGEEAVFAYIVNITTDVDEDMAVYYYVEDVSKASGSIDYSVYDVTKTGFLNVTMSTPPEGDTTNVRQNFTFTLNATITCEQGFCGNVSGTARYNQSSETADTTIPTSYATPFYIMGGSNPRECSNNPLGLGENCNLSWTVNASGETDTYWNVDAYFTSVAPQVTVNDTTDATMRIIKGTVVISLTWNLLDFGIVSPQTYANNATGNQGQGYNITIEPESIDVEGLYIKGSDLHPQDIVQIDDIIYGIGVSNISWNDNEFNYSAGTTERLTKDYALMRNSVPADTVIPTYFWIDALGGQYAQEYLGNLTIMANATT